MVSAWRSVILALALGLKSAALWAESPGEAQLSELLTRMEADLPARVGVFILEPATGWAWSYRADQRFPMASTVKSLLCAAALDRVARGDWALHDLLPVTLTPGIGHAPVTERRIGGSMTLDETCLAATDQSDNGAANMLIAALGGPEAVTAFLRASGDAVTRLDRYEPDLNDVAPGDLRDTTTPEAMVRSWTQFLIGDGLPPAEQALLRDWMGRGGATGDLVRPHLPAGWGIVDRSGGGRRLSRAVVALVSLPEGGDYVLAIYLNEAPVSFAARTAAVSEVAEAVIAVIAARNGG